MALTVGLTYDLKAEYLAAGYGAEAVAEFDSKETIDALEAAIASLGHRVERIGGARALAERLVAGDRWDLVFNIAEGLCGRCREAQVPAILELYGVPYTFSDPLVLAATLDKAVAKRLVQSARIRTPKFAVVRDMAGVGAVKIPFPLFAKPIAEGSGKGVEEKSVAKDTKDLARICSWLLARFDEPVLVEEFLPGREFTAGILGTRAAARVVGVMEVEIVATKRGGVYTRINKDECEKLVRYTKLDAGTLRKSIEKLSLAAYRTLECRDAARVDVRCDRRGRPSFIEINSLPGLHPTHSDLPMLAEAEGMSYNSLIGAIVESASARINKRP